MHNCLALVYFLSRRPRAIVEKHGRKQMLRSLLRVFLLALPLFVGTLSGAADAKAADLSPFAKAPPPEGPVEWGSGWYLRGDVGWQNLRMPVVTSDFTKVNNINNVANPGLGVGYQVNDWLRFDVTADRSVFRMNRALDTVWCPYSTLGLFQYDPVLEKDVPVGIFANPNETCWPLVKGTLNRTSLLANGYFDIGHYWGFTPYIGAGVGTSYNQASSSLVYYCTSDGGVWAPDLSMPEDPNVPRWVTLGGAPWPVQIPFAPTNYNRFSEKNPGLSPGTSWPASPTTFRTISRSMSVIAFSTPAPTRVCPASGRNAPPRPAPSLPMRCASACA